MNFRLRLGLFLLLTLAGLIPARAADLTLGATIRGTIAQPGDQAVYTFQGTAGQRFFYDALDLNTANLAMRLIGPSGTTFFTQLHYQDRLPFTLVETGIHRLVIDGNSFATGNFGFRLLDLATAAGLPIGPQVTGQLAQRSEAALYRFTGRAGQKLAIKRLASSSTEAAWHLFSPADQQLAVAGISSDLGNSLLPIDGVYTLIVAGSSANPGTLDYQFLVADLSEARGTPAGFGDLRSGTLTATQTNQFTFTGYAGQWIYFDSQDRNTAVVVDLRAPPGNGTPILTINAGQDSVPYVLPLSGNYAISVRGTGTYRFRWLDLSAAPAVPLNTDRTVALAAPFQTDVYRLPATAGQRYYYDAIDADQDAVTVRLWDPTGTRLLVSQNSDFDFGPLLAGLNGTYYLMVESGLAAATDYRFRFLDYATLPVLPLNTLVTTPLSSGKISAAYRFDGVAGQRYFFDGRGTNTQLLMYLFGPNNLEVTEANLQRNMEVDLTSTGPYFFLLYGDNPSPVTASFRVGMPTIKSNTLALGATIVGRIAEPGEEHVFTFAGAPGQRLFYDTWLGDNLTLRLVGPSGADVISARNAAVDYGPFTLSEAGNYSLILDGNDEAVPNYVFRLLAAAVAPSKALPLGTPVGGDLAPVPAAWLDVIGSYVNKSLRAYTNQDDWRASQTMAGTRKDPTLNFTDNSWGRRADVGLTGGSDADWAAYSVQWDGNITIPVEGARLFTRSDDGSRMWIDLNRDGKFDPDGAEFVNNNWGAGQGVTTGPASVGLAVGTYRIRIQYEDDGGGNNLILLTDNGLSINPGTRAEIYRFEAAPGDRFYIAPLPMENGARWASGGTWFVFGPNNEQITAAGFRGVLDFTATRAGTHLLILNANSSDPVPFNFQVFTPTTVTLPLVTGAVARNTLTGPGDVHRLTFNGMAGQRFYLDALNPSSPLRYRFINPGGGYLERVAYQDLGPFTLRETGVYTLQVFGSGSATGEYALRLVDLDSIQARRLVLGNTYGLTPVPASALKVTGSYVNTSLRGYAPQDDWRATQPIAGTRADAQINFSQTGWGQRAAVGLSAGPDDDWNNFSVQWDGSITIPKSGMRLYSQSDDGTRLWVDLNGDGVFGTAAPELVNNGWGVGHGLTLGSALPVSSPGSYRLRLQYEEGSGGNEMFLLWDQAELLSPAARAELFHFTGQAGQRLFFDSLRGLGGAGWALYGPNNEAMPGGNQNIVSDFEVTLAATGEYVLVLDGSTTNDVPYSFRVSATETPLRAIVPGESVAGTLAGAGDQHVFTFQGTVGQRLFYDALTPFTTAIRARLESPSGTLVLTTGHLHYQDAGPFSLPESGLYRLVVDGDGDTVGAYAFRLVDVAALPAFDIGPVVGGSLNPRSAANLYRFNGTAGQRLSFKRLSASGNDATWELFSPANESLLSRSLTGDLGEALLPLTGVYVLAVKGPVAAGDPFTYQILAAYLTQNPGGEPVGLADLRSGTLRAGDTNRFTFTAPAGRWVYFDSQDATSGNLTVELRDPSGANVPGTPVNAASDAGPFVLPAGGTYSVLVRGGNPTITGSYRFRWLDLAAAPVLNMGRDTAAELNPGYQTEVYQFMGVAGQRLRYDGLQNDSDGTTVSLFTPNGRITHLNGGANNDVELFTLAESGPHYLLLRANRVPTANYAFRLVDLAAQPPLPLNATVDVTLTPGLGTQLYRLEGTAGQRFFFQGLGTNRNANYYLYGPQNQYLAGGNVINNFEATLAVSGVSALVVIGSGDAPVLCSFRVVPQTPSETPLVPGANVSGRLSQPGQQNTYTFTGRPGQRLFFDGLDTGSDPIFARLDDPTGTQIFTRSTRGDIGPFKLAESGQYRLLVYASGDAVGDYHFRLLDADVAPSEAIEFGRTYGGELVPVPATFLQLTSSYINKSLSTYTNQDDWKISQTIAGTRPDKQIDFPAAAAWGLRSSVGLTGGTDANWENFSVQWDGSITIPVAGTRLFLRSDDSSRMWIDLNNDGKFDAEGAEFLNNSWGRNQGATLSSPGAALPAGTYRFRVQYEERSSDNVMQLLWDNALSLAPVAGARIYRVEGKAGQKLFVDGFGPDTRGALYLYGPDNDTPGSAAVNGAGVAGNFEKVLEVSGSYLLMLTGNSPEGALPFAFRVNAIDLTPRPLTLGDVVTSQLAQAGEEHRYVFTGAPGQQLYYDGQGSDASLFARLVQPDGSTQLTVGAGNDQGIFQLKQAGLYQLVIYGTGDNTGNYRFQLLDVAAQPTLPLGTVLGGTLSPGRATAIYRLPASPGERFYFDGLGTNNGAGWRLMAPTTEVVGDANVTGDFEPASLTRAGVYALVIYGNVDAPVTYSVRVLVPADAGAVRNLPPLISAIPALSAPVGQVIGPINFTVQDTETAAANLKVTAVSSEPRLLPGERINLGGAGANRTVTLTPLANQTGNTIVTLTVTDADGASASISFPVTITGGNRPPTLSAIPDQNAAEGATVGPIALTVDDAETAPAALMLDGQSSNQELLRNSAIVFGGRGQTRTLTLFPTAGRTGQATITVTLADLDGGRTTRNFLLTVTTTPAFIRTQPTGQTVRVGASTRFEVSAGGTAPLAYQWRFNGTNIAGAIAPALNLNSVTPAAAGDYSVRVANAGGSVTSQVARLRVLVPPVITLQPAPATVAPGAAVTFRVQVAGAGPFRYQWQLNGVSMPGQNNATLTLSPVQISDAGVYRVVVASLDGALVSDPARLTVLADALAFANDFAGRVKLTSPAGSGRGVNTGFTREPNEPVHAGRVGGASAWIAWVAPGDGVAVFTTRGSSFDTLLGVYTGGTLASLIRVAGDDDSGGFATSATRFNVTRGTEYQIAIDGLKRASGEIVLRWEFTATTTLPPVILSSPAGQVVLVGATAAFSVTAINPPGALGPLSYQWFLNGRLLTGQTFATLTVPNAQAEDVGNYTVEVANSGASVTSAAAVLQLSSADTDPRNAGVGSEDKFAVLTTLDLPGGLIPTGSPQPAAVPRGPGSRAGAAVARGYTSTQVFNTSGSGTEEGEPNHCGVIGGASQWFAYQPEANGTLTVSTDGSDFDTVLAIYTGPGDSFETLTQIICDNDSGADGKDSLVRFAATAGVTYYVAVDGVNGATGNVRLAYKLDGPARLTPLPFTDGQFRLRLNGLPGQGYTIEVSSGLPVWQPLTGVNAPSGVVEFGDPDAPNAPIRFYRATTTP